MERIYAHRSPRARVHARARARRDARANPHPTHGCLATAAFESATHRARAHLVSHRAHAHSATPVWDSTRTTAAGASAHVPHITSGMTRERSFEVVRGRLCVCRSAARGRAASRRVGASSPNARASVSRPARRAPSRRRVGFKRSRVRPTDLCTNSHVPSIHQRRFQTLACPTDRYRPVYVQTVTYQVYINRTYTMHENAHRA